jgi:hypothetical protein
MQQAQPTTQATGQLCDLCRVALASGQTFFTKSGQAVCRSCLATETLAMHNARSSSTKNASGRGLALQVLAACLLPFIGAYVGSVVAGPAGDYAGVFVALMEAGGFVVGAVLALCAIVILARRYYLARRR